MPTWLQNLARVVAGQGTAPERVRVADLAQVAAAVMAPVVEPASRSAVCAHSGGPRALT